MKTITAKEFQLNQSKMMKEVANGVVYQVTYHGKPWVELHPGTRPKPGARPGSPRAFRESLDFTLNPAKLPPQPDYKGIRKQHLLQKYGN